MSTTTTIERLDRARPGTIGGAGVIEAAREFVVDVPTVAGLWPFGQPSGDGAEGIPLGIDPNSGRLACYDPHSAFVAGRQRAAQLAILATNGTGKSVLAKKLATGLAGQGIPTIVPFDAKNEYTGLVEALGGTALAVGRDGGLNAIDPGEAITQAAAAGAPERVMAELRARRNQLVATIAGISRGTALTGWEQTALSAVLDQLPPGSVLVDLAEAFTTDQDYLASVIGRDPQRVDQLLEPLALDIAALAGGSIGQVLGTAGPDQAWPVDRPLMIDTSAILATEPELTAAVTVTCWTAALSAIYLTNTVRDQVYAVIFDEIWRATRDFPALANQIGGLMRMDRNDGIITIIATHSWTDTANPGGSNILARCAAFAIGGLQNEEVNAIATAGIGLNPAELAEIRANSAAGTTSTRGGTTAHGGTGRFLIKTGEHPGRLIQTILTRTEQTLFDTNQKWTTDLGHLDEADHLLLGEADGPVTDAQASSWPDGAPIYRIEDLSPSPVDLNAFRPTPHPARDLDENPRPAGAPGSVLVDELAAIDTEDEEDLVDVDSESAPVGERVRWSTEDLVVAADDGEGLSAALGGPQGDVDTFLGARPEEFAAMVSQAREGYRAGINADQILEELISNSGTDDNPPCERRAVALDVARALWCGSAVAYSSGLLVGVDHIAWLTVLLVVAGLLVVVAPSQRLSVIVEDGEEEC